MSNFFNIRIFQTDQENKPTIFKNILLCVLQHTYICLLDFKTGNEHINIICYFRYVQYLHKIHFNVITYRH